LASIIDGEPDDHVSWLASDSYEQMKASWKGTGGSATSRRNELPALAHMRSLLVKELSRTVQEMNDDRTDWNADDPINGRVAVKPVVF